MNLAEFQSARQKQIEPTQFRIICQSCLQPSFSCFCSWLKPFDPMMNFIILSHPLEAYKRIATGRLAHMSLTGSKLIVGHDYSHSEALNQILSDPNLFPVLLYPGLQSMNLSLMTEEQRQEVLPRGRKLAVLVVDGTWSTARKTVHLSRNLKGLPRVCFSPTRPSAFRVRQQPRPECVSTIEAIHQFIELVGRTCGLNLKDRKHDSLLEIFDRMVNLQLSLARQKAKSSRRRKMANVR